MILTPKELDPSLIVVDNLFGAQELASNFAPTAEQERGSSPQAGRLASSLHEVLRLHFTGDGAFVRDGEPGTTQPERQATDALEVMVTIDGFRGLLGQRRVSRQNASREPSIIPAPSYLTAV